MSGFCAPPQNFLFSKASSSSGSDAYVSNDAVTAGLSSRSRKVVAGLICGLGLLASSIVDTHAAATTTEVVKPAWNDLVSICEPVLLNNDDVTQLPAELSGSLQKFFGFNNAQWSSVIKVERKTLYNWAKNPETNVHQRIVARLEVLDHFSKEIDNEHARFFPKKAFGRHADASLAAALQHKELSYDSLVDEYDRLYADLDGMYKRMKHKA